MKPKNVRVSVRPSLSDYRVTWRTRKLSTPKRIVKIPEEIPSYTIYKVRTSALKGTCNDRIKDISWPYARKVRDCKRLHRRHLNDKKLKNLDITLEASNATIYSKLANSDVEANKPSSDKYKQKKWSESDWRKHMTHIGPLANPKKTHLPKRITKKKWKPLQKLMPHINRMATLAPCKVYRRPSQEDWYKDPLKVSEKALKYDASDRVKVLAKPTVIDPSNPHCIL